MLPRCRRRRKVLLFVAVVGFALSQPLPLFLSLSHSNSPPKSAAPQQQQSRTQIGVRVEARAAHLFYRRPGAAAVVLATSRKGGFARCRRHGACFWLSYDAVGSRMLRYGRGYEVEGAVLAEASVPFLLPLKVAAADAPPSSGNGEGGVGGAAAAVLVEVDDDPLTREPSARLLRVGGAFDSQPVAASPHVARLSARTAGGQQHASRRAPSSSSSSSRRGRAPSVSVASRPLTITPSPLALPPGAPCSLLSLGDPRAPVRFDELPATCRTLVAALCSPGLDLEWPGTPPGTLVAAISRSLRCGLLKEALEKKAARGMKCANSRPASAVASPEAAGGVPARPRTPAPPPALPYLRVAVAAATRSAPGEPFVLEIWPAGCRSPIHSHGGACGAFRVLHGTCTLSLYNASGADGDSSSDDEDEDGEEGEDGAGSGENGENGENGHAGSKTHRSSGKKNKSRNNEKKNRFARRPHLVATCSRGDVGWFDSGHHQTHSIGADAGPPGSFCATLQAFRYADDDDAQLPFMEVEPAAAAAADAARKRRRRAAAEAEAEAAAAASLAASASGGSLASAPSRPVPPPAPADFSPVSDFQFAEMARLVLAEFEAIEEWSRGSGGGDGNVNGGAEGTMIEVEAAGSAAAAAAAVAKAAVAADSSLPKPAPAASQGMCSSDEEDEDAAELDSFDWTI